MPKRNGENGRDTRMGVPKKRTRFPGQLIECGTCGYGYVFGGHGQTDHLMCDGARGYRCWNGVIVDGPLAAEKITAAVLAEVESLPDFDEAFLAIINEEANRLDAEDASKQRQNEQQMRRLDRKLDNLLKFVREGHASPRVHQEIAHAEEEHGPFHVELVPPLFELPPEDLRQTEFPPQPLEHQRRPDPPGRRVRTVSATERLVSPDAYASSTGSYRSGIHHRSREIM